MAVEADTGEVEFDIVLLKVLDVLESCGCLLSRFFFQQKQSQGVRFHLRGTIAVHKKAVLISCCLTF